MMTMTFDCQRVKPKAKALYNLSMRDRSSRAGRAKGEASNGRTVKKLCVALVRTRRRASDVATVWGNVIEVERAKDVLFRRDADPGALSPIAVSKQTLILEIESLELGP